MSSMKFVFSNPEQIQLPFPSTGLPTLSFLTLHSPAHGTAPFTGDGSLPTVQMGDAKADERHAERASMHARPASHEPHHEIPHEPLTRTPRDPHS